LLSLRHCRDAIDAIIFIAAAIIFAIIDISLPIFRLMILMILMLIFDIIIRHYFTPLRH
jgi:hypothetical protein